MFRRCYLIAPLLIKIVLGMTLIKVALSLYRLVKIPVCAQESSFPSISGNLEDDNGDNSIICEDGGMVGTAVE